MLSLFEETLENVLKVVKEYGLNGRGWWFENF